MNKTPLYDWHLKHNGRMVDFASWLLPVSYTSIIEEHMHTRSEASVFDICHMGQIIVKGADACGFLDALLTNNIASMQVGQCRYSFMLNDEGAIIDDLIVYRFDDRFMVVVNAARRETDINWMNARLKGGVEIKDASFDIAKIDLQGPKAFQAAIEATGIDLSDLGYYRFREHLWNGLDLVISRTGYTGELGYEFYCSAEHAERLWNAFLNVEFVKPAGLGARDSLRLEMGYPLYGQDISEEVSPIEAGMERFVDLNKDFIGKGPMFKRAESASRRLKGLIGKMRRPFRHNDVVVDENGMEIGVITSGGYAPSLGVAVGLAYIDDTVNNGEKVFVRNEKGAVMEAIVEDYPFYKNGSVRIKVGESVV